jgi:hypothetical protein
VRLASGPELIAARATQSPWQGKAARRIWWIRTARGRRERGDGAPAFGSTDPRRRQATSLFSRADQTSVIKIAREGMAAISANAVKPPAARES